MSSKTQYKDALGKANHAIGELKNEMIKLNKIIVLLKKQIEYLKIKSIKWWQFWK